MTARELAISVLTRVAKTDAYLNVVLDSQLSSVSLADPRDAALVTELCYGTVRRQLLLDAAISKFADRRLDQLEDTVLAALRIGAYQLYFTRMPRHAAVGETVTALKSLKLERAAGFVNAILRKLSALEAPPIPAEESEAAQLSIQESHPLWMVERWLRQFGRDRTIAMLEANNTAARVTARVNTTRTSRDALLEQLREAGIAAEPTSLSPLGIAFSPTGRVDDLLGHREGLWQVQDEAAQLVGLYADVPPGARVLDVCAAPGGKTCHLLEQHTVVAAELHENKLPKIQQAATRLGLAERLTLRVHDATQPFPDEWGSFDAVIVDAPCSGTGTLRRHPELRYRRTDADVGRLATLQRRILEQAQAAVAPGGLLIFAVCSVDFREGVDQSELFLRSHPEFTVEPPTSGAASRLPLWQGALRTLPGPEGMDGFYAVRMRKLH